MDRKIKVMADNTTSSQATSTNPAPSFMMRRTPLSRWVRGNTWATPLTHAGAPSMENPWLASLAFTPAESG